MMLRKITVPINLEYTDEMPVNRQQQVWAWVCGGFALHKAIVCEMSGIFDPRYWCITHVNSGHTIVPFASHKLVALRNFADLQHVSVAGVRMGDMSYEQVQAYQVELRPKLHRIFYPHMHLIGGDLEIHVIARDT